DIPDKPVGRGQRGGSVSTPNVKAVQRLFVDREELRLPPPQNLLFPLFDSASVQLDPPLIDDHFRLTTRKDIEAVDSPLHNLILGLWRDERDRHRRTSGIKCGSDNGGAPP